MKYLLLSFCIGVLAITGANAQNVEVPAIVQKTFATEHPKAKDATWEAEADNLFEVEFKEDGTEYEIVYAATGAWVSKAQEVTINELPSVILSSVTSRWDADEVNKISKIELANGSVQFEVEVGGFELLFDADGELLSREEVDSDED